MAPNLTKIERLRDARESDLKLERQGIHKTITLFEEMKKIVLEETWDEFEQLIYDHVRLNRVVLKNWPIIHFRAFAYDGGNVVALEFKYEDDKKPRILRFSTRLDRCGLLDNADDLPESHQEIIRGCFGFYNWYICEVRNIESAYNAIQKQTKDSEFTEVGE